ncbi:MAG: hypothetical protein A4E59_03006 [Syntrophorhabdus sp. PtaB.Bin027]|nr:MAG: hypothetical protein A4E59_03006 [Syntrophorhabdus sp. PtaB.Bin027]
MFYCRLIPVICFFIAVAVFSFSSPLQGAEWKMFYQKMNEKGAGGKYENLNYYYDKESIEKPSKGIARVWFKTTVGDDDSENLAEKDGSDESEQYRGHIEINCKSKSYRMIEETSSDSSESEGKGLQTSAGKAPRRLYLDSALGALWSNLCE